MTSLKNGVYSDSKHVEELCFLKIAYDFFPGGEYRVSELHKMAEENSDSIFKWRSDSFPGAEPMDATGLSDYLFNMGIRCSELGFVLSKGKARTSSTTILKNMEEVERVLADPWRSLETDVDGFSRGEGVKPPGVDYFRDFISKAKEAYGRRDMGAVEFLNGVKMSARNDYPASVIIGNLYEKGFLELRGKMESSGSKTPAFAPLRVRLKGDVFRPEISEKIENSGYVSEAWDGRLPVASSDIEELMRMFKSQPFSNNEFEATKLYRRGYLEKTRSYIVPGGERFSGYNIQYRLKKEVSDVLFK